MNALVEQMREALEPLPDELLDDARVRCAFYTKELSYDEIFQIGKDFVVFDAAARDAEAERRRRAA